MSRRGTGRRLSLDKCLGGPRPVPPTKRGASGHHCRVPDRLGAYRDKRAATSPEPAAEAEGRRDEAAPRFVVQEHSARRLHWDLRLEHDGVAVSWAVPRGIPDRPEDNRLAVHTEDHPLEYLSWEGVIPAGHYGAGTMAVWDAGTYEQHKWRADEVMVTFHGERVRGRYVLFRTKGDDWMIHRMDPPADPAAAPLPATMAPMLARLGTLPADGRAWVYEVKWDGVRALVWVEGGQVRLESRNGRDISSQYPEVAGLGRGVGARPVLLDGEVVALDADGHPSFERLQRRMHLASEAAVRRRMSDTPVTLMLFDVLHLDGRSLLEQPWEERRARLEELALAGPSWRTPPVHRGHGGAFLQATKDQGLEGLVAKRADSPYEPGRRTGAWVKVKNVTRQELVIGGWLPGEGRRRERIGSLLVGLHDGDQLRYAGRVGTGFTETELRRLGELLAPLERPTSPFARRGLPKGAVWVEPRLVAEVEFREWTSAGILRAPAYKGLRDDRDPDTVVREDREPEVEREVPAAPPPAAPAAGAELEVDGRRLRLSNLEKVLYPAAGFTKAQVIDYYIRVAPALLPHLRERPLTLKRYPDGVDAPFFYEKNSPRHRPEWVRTVEVGGSRGTTNHTVVDGLPTLVWVANLAGLELHTSLSRAEEIARPTMMVFDLDPGAPADVVDCCQVGIWLRDLFADLGVSCVVKTSGSKGLQVYVPLNVRDVTYRDTKPFARAVAELLERRHPDLVVSRMTKSLRPGKVFVDWSQNDQHKTTVCAYSLRAREQPTVSTPVSWDEVGGALSARDAERLRFTAPEVIARVTEPGDLFAPTLEVEQELPRL
jgi:bifunctional non-homologous end joining protein LigD